MALKGTLKDFAIADIFQLIGVQQKDGVLKLKDNERAIDVFFIKGKIVGAESTVRDRKEHIGEMLLRADLISREDLTKALNKQRETLQKLGDIFLQYEMISLEHLREMIQLQITETIYGLFNWKSGDYEFVQQKVEYEKEHLTPLSPEGVLMDGFRILDEWPKVKRVIKSYDMVFQKAFGIENKLMLAEEDEGESEDDLDAAFDIFEGDKDDKKDKKDKKDKNKLDGNGKRVFNYVDGKRTVQHLIDLCRIGEFETCKALVNLTEADLIELTTAEKKSRKEVKGHEKLGTFANVAFLLLFTVIVYMFTVTIGLKNDAKISTKLFFDVKQYNVLKEFQALRQIDELGNAVYLYYLRNQSYPEDLNSLVNENLIDESDMIDPWGNKFLYKSTKKSFEIKSLENKTY
jgi:hypothetical protein